MKKEGRLDEVFLLIFGRLKRYAVLEFDPLGARPPAVLSAMFGQSLARAAKVISASLKFKRF